MRRLAIVGIALVLAACGGSSTGTVPDRWNFAVVDGANQSSTAGAPALSKPITAMLTRDAQGKFATRVFDWIAPRLAYAQGIVLSGTPVANAIVCGREAKPGEPQVVPLCAFTLADGKAANSVVGGTKAGTYTMLFTAQVPSELPVKDSTNVTVLPGPASPNFHTTGPLSGSPYVLPVDAVQDQFGNAIADYSIIGDDVITVTDHTLSWSTISNTYRLLDILDAKGALIGHLRYRIPPGDPRLEWVAFGLNSNP